MTTNQTIDGVPRRMLEEISVLLYRVKCTPLEQELRALLDAPAKSFAQIASESAYCQKAPAAQPQGEPVMPERLREIHEFLLGSESLDGYSFGSLHPSGRKYWWRNELRACLDEVTRLNTK